MKRKYEIVYIFDSALEEPEVNEHLERFHDLLKSPDQAEPITGIAHWGKRTLAYPIKNKETGYYVVAHFEAETGLLSEFERVIKLADNVLRYLVVINEGLSVTRPDNLESTGASGSGGTAAASEPAESVDAPTPPADAPAVADANEEPKAEVDGGGE